MTTFFLIRQNAQTLKSRSWSRLEILTRFRSRRLRSRLHHCWYFISCVPSLSFSGKTSVVIAGDHALG